MSRIDIEEIWGSYKKCYLNFNLTITRLKLISKYSGKIFEKFPESMPLELKLEYQRNGSNFIRNMMDTNSIDGREVSSNDFREMFFGDLNQNIPVEVNYLVNKGMLDIETKCDTDFVG